MFSFGYLEASFHVAKTSVTHSGQQVSFVAFISLK